MVCCHQTMKFKWSLFVCAIGWMSLFLSFSATAATNPSFPWDTPTHNEVVGDFNNDGQSDSFIQSKTRGGLSGIMPTTPAVAIDSPIYLQWSGAHPQLGGIDDWSGVSYTAYADNLTAAPGDEILLLGKQQFILIHSDISVPLFIAPNVSGAIVSFDALGQASYSEINLAINGEDYQPLFADFDGDGDNEILLQSNASSEDSYIIDGDGALSQTLSFGYLGLDWSNASDFEFFDANGDGFIDIRVTDADGNIALLYASPGGTFATNPTLITASADVPPTPHIEPIPARDPNSDSIGAINGVFRVDESGQSNYQVPIYTPQGVAGVTPEVALAYNSGGSNGYLGVGWSIQGLSAISRCGKSRIIDGENGAVNLDEDDRFCLDGEKLVLVTGDYGQPGSEYRTHMASQIKVIAQGVAGNGPDYFDVWRKDGSYSRYGYTDDSQFRANNNGTVIDTVLTWARSSTEDRFSNAIDFHYFEDESAGEFHIESITYAPDLKIQFNFNNTRTDYKNGYYAGGKTQLKDILESIQVYEGTTEVRQYEFEYALGKSLQNRLVKIKESKDGVYLQPTTFTWANPDKGLVPDLTRTKGIRFLNGSYFNVDNDLTPEWLHVGNGNGSGINKATFLSISEFRGGRYEITCQGGITPATKLDGNIEVFDINGDGIDEAILVGNDKLYAVFFKDGCLDPDENQGVVPIADISTDNSHWFFGDINGDALPDLVYQRNQAAYIRYHLGNNSVGNNYFSAEVRASFNLPSYPAGTVDIYNDTSTILIPEYRTTTSYSAEHSSYGDFNSDGRMDMVIKVTMRTAFNEDYCLFDLGLLVCQQEPRPSPSVSHSWVMVTSNGDGSFDEFINLGNVGARADRDIQFVDVNTDGLPDLVFKGYTNWHYRLFTGKQFLGVVDTQVPKTGPIWFADHDLDGRMEIYNAHPNENLYYREMRQDGTLDTTHIRSFVWGANNAHMTFVDVNADGELDIVSVIVDERSRRTDYLTYVSRKQNEFQIRDAITQIDNGFGNLTKITYKSLTDETQPDLYEDHAGWGYDALGYVVNNIRGPQYVVQKAESSAPAHNNANNMNSIEYRYGKRRSHSAYGSMGFEWLETQDSQTDIVTRTTYQQEYPFIGQPESTQVWFGERLDSRLISRATKSYTVKNVGTYTKSTGETGQRIFPYMSRAVEEGFDFDEPALQTGALVSQTITTNAYNNYGDPTEMNVYTCEGNAVDCDISGHWFKRVRTVNSYLTANTNQWILGRLSQATVNHYRAGETTMTRTTGFEYNATTGILTAEIIQPNSSVANESSRTEYRHDTFGNTISQRVCQGTTRCSTTMTEPNADSSHADWENSLNVINRVSTMEYDSEGRYLVREKNSYGQVTHEVLARNELGQPTQVKNSHGVVSDIRYGTFGQDYFTRSATGRWSQRTQAFCSALSTCPAGALVEQIHRTAGGGESKVYTDKLGRTLLELSKSFNGAWVAVATEYTEDALTHRTSLPYFQATETPQWVTQSYDRLNRLIQITYADGSSDTTTYLPFDSANQLTGRVTRNALQQPKTEYHNVVGELAKVLDSDDNALVYRYDATGNLTQVTLNDVLQSEIEFDSLGRKITMWDWDKGAQNNQFWTYAYNALGELTTQTDAKGQRTVTYRDREGRQVRRLDINTANQWEADARWLFDNASTPAFAETAGQLTQQYDAINNELVVEPEYDNLGRHDVTKTTINGHLFIRSMTYDEFGRQFQDFDVAGQNYGLRYIYNEHGHLAQVRESRGANLGEVYRTITSVDAFGNVTGETLGNGLTSSRQYDAETGRLLTIITTDRFGNSVQDLDYTWDTLGRMTHRKAFNKNLTEVFTYDNLNRVKTINGVNHYNYDAQGNITWKKAVGHYTYGATCGGVKAGHHAVTKAGGKSYCYDLNGNLLSGDGRTVEYSVFDKSTRISKGNHTTEFRYAPTRSRYKRVDNGADGVSVTYYLGNTEYIIDPEGNTSYRRSLPGAVVKVASRGGYSVNYLHTDHLGSTDVITNSAGNRVSEMSFDAFGLKRHVETWRHLASEPVWAGPLAITSKGYTGHEMADEVGVIHMNGRIYDAKLGRFMQADPFVDGATDSQGYNRYTYVRNNPLAYTDPTGYRRSKGLRRLGKIARASQGVGGLLFGHNPTFQQAYQFAANIAAGVVAAGCIPCAAGISAAASATSAAALGGNLSQSLESGAKAYATTYISAHVAGDIGERFKGVNGVGGHNSVLQASFEHGALSGVMSVLNGGKFGHGFASGFVSKYAGEEIDLKKRIPNSKSTRIFTAGIIGGTVSAATGGKFANGAIQSAIQWAFNAEGVRDEVVTDEVVTDTQKEDSIWGIPGTEAGDRAAQYWADIAVKSDHPLASLAHVPGALAVLWTDETAVDTALTLGGGGIAKGVSWALGPAKQWFRLKGSYSHAMGQKTALTLSFGASPKHVHKIPTEIGRSINRWFRSLKIPGSSWRTQDAGHLHIKK